MEKVLHILNIVGMVAVALPALVSALIMFFMAIPGAQPEKFLNEKVMPLLQKVVAVIEKFSKK
jgi:hypothetical protein